MSANAGLQSPLANNGVLSRKALTAMSANDGLQSALAKNGVLSREAFTATAVDLRIARASSGDEYERS
jgi:hypothetical protein